METLFIIYKTISIMYTMKLFDFKKLVNAKCLKNIDLRNEDTMHYVGILCMMWVSHTLKDTSSNETAFVKQWIVINLKQKIKYYYATIAYHARYYYLLYAFLTEVCTMVLISQ